MQEDRTELKEQNEENLKEVPKEKSIFLKTLFFQTQNIFLIRIGTQKY